MKTPCNKQIKFILFFRMRSGSHLLRSLLNSHPDILCDGEIFAWHQADKIPFPYDHINEKCSQCEQAAYGFKVSIKHLMRYQEIDSRAFLLNLSELNWKIIYLQRQNLLRQAISIQIARSRNKWRDKTPNALKGAKFVLDNQVLSQDLAQLEADYIEEKRSLAGIAHKTIRYEQELLDSREHQATMNEVFDYLGIWSAPVKSAVFRTSSDKISDFIENYDEMVHFISQTKYANFLAE